MTSRQKARKELLALAERFEGPPDRPIFDVSPKEVECWARQFCAEQLRDLVDRLFPEKAPAPPPPTGTAVCVFKVLGGGEYPVTEAILKELAARYELPEAYLLKELELVASKITAGVVTKKTERGMVRALYSWSEVARRKWERSAVLGVLKTGQARENPQPAAAPPKPNGSAPRVVTIGHGEKAVLVDQTLYRREEWPASRGPWPGGAP